MEFLSNYWQFMVPAVICVAALAVIVFAIRRDREEEGNEADNPFSLSAEVAEAEKRLRPDPKAAE